VTTDRPDADPPHVDPQPPFTGPRGWSGSQPSGPEDSASGQQVPGTGEHPSVITSPAPGRRVLGSLRAGLAAAIGLALLGAPLGLLWFLVAPAVPVIKVEGGAVPADPEPEQFIAADGWFVLLGLGFGVLAAVAVWRILRRLRGPAGMVVVIVGTLGASLLAAWLGSEISLAEYHRVHDSVAVGEAFSMPPRLRSVDWFHGLPVPRGSVLVPPLGAAMLYTLLAGWSLDPELVPAPTPPSSGWASPQTPPAPPAPPAAGTAGPVPD
jgi:hypothetical protein